MENHLIPMDHDACGVGFVTQLGGDASHEIVERALEALRRLAHRGGVDADGRSGDGAGLLTQIPDRFIRYQASQAGIEPPFAIGLGLVFLPRGGEETARRSIEAIVRKNDLRCLGWRLVPTNPEMTGPRATETLPVIEQCFIAPERPTADLEALLFRLRKEVEADVPSGTYFCSLSSRTVVYKGLLTPQQ